MSSDQEFAGVLLVDPRGWILLQERDEHAPIDPDQWGLSGGHLEDGEDPLAGALRELAEETGVSLASADLHAFDTFVVDHTSSRGTHVVMHVYAYSSTLTDADIVCTEGRQIVFVDPVRARAST